MILQAYVLCFHVIFYHILYAMFYIYIYCILKKQHAVYVKILDIIHAAVQSMSQLQYIFSLIESVQSKPNNCCESLILMFFSQQL